MFRRLLANFEQYLVGGVFLATAGLVCVQVACRYFGVSIAASEEISRYLLVWCVMLGGAAAARQGEHLGVEFLSRRLPSRWARWVPLVGLAAMAAFFTVLGVQGLRYVRGSYELGETSQGLGLPVWATLHLAIPVGAFLIALRSAERALRITLRGRTP